MKRKATAMVCAWGHVHAVDRDGPLLSFTKKKKNPTDDGNIQVLKIFGVIIYTVLKWLGNIQ